MKTDSKQSEAHLKELIQGYKTKIRTLEDALKIIQENKSDSEYEDVKVYEPLHENGGGHTTFKEWLSLIFEDEKPKTSRELLIEWNKFTKKNISPKDLSVKLAGYSKRGVISKDKIDKSNFYGLKSWFNGDKFMASYQSKIKKRTE